MTLVSESSPQQLSQDQRPPLARPAAGIAALALVSLVWAFSFGLIKQNLTGLSPSFVAAARMLLACLIFLPVTRLRHIPAGLLLRLSICGAAQFGLMYIFYNWSFRLLAAHEVALFTIFTPLYVTLLDDLPRGRLNWRYLLCAALAVAGTGVIVYRNPGRSDLPAGFALVQASNLCFAFGQIYYRRIRAAHPQHRDREIFAWLYLGAAIATSAAAAFTARQSVAALHPRQIWALIYLGVIASGACFFLWNVGARLVNVGTLAVFNNAKVPLAVACSILFFHEHASLSRLLAGGSIILLAMLAARPGARSTRD